jgi:hypothetical protein
VTVAIGVSKDDACDISSSSLKAMLRKNDATVSLAEERLAISSGFGFGSLRHRPSAPSVLIDLLENRACF